MANSDLKVNVGVNLLANNAELQKQLDIYAKKLKANTTIGLDYVKAQKDAKEAAKKIQQILQQAYKQSTGKKLSSEDAQKYTTEYLNEYMKTANQASAITKKFASEGLKMVISSTKEALNELKEIDTLMTGISKADGSLSKSELADIADNSFDMASKYGILATNYLANVQEMSKAGYTAAEGMAELSTAAQSAGDMTGALTNQYIIAIDKAYGLKGNVNALTEALDGANNISNNNMVNMSELAKGLTAIGSEAASSGVAVDEATAALATMVAVTGQGGSEMSNAFKDILTNLPQIASVLNNSLSVKDPMQALKELSEEYSKLGQSDTKRLDLLNAAGGKDQANALTAILENYGMYEKMLQDYADGTGSMARDAEKTANSWEGSLNRVKNTWTDTVENVANSDAIITLINSFNGLLSTLNSVTDTLGSLGTLGAGIGAVLGAKNVGRDNMFSLI